MNANTLPLKKRKPRLQAYNVYDKMWLQRFLELQDFKKQYGHCDVPQRYSPNKSLGKWLHKQRHECRRMQRKKTSPMNEYRLRMLLDIGFQPTTNNRAESLWHRRFLELCRFREENGHCNIPQLYSLNVSLGKWVHRQRFELRKFQRGAVSHLTSHRIDALKAVGFR